MPGSAARATFTLPAPAIAALAQVASTPLRPAPDRMQPLGPRGLDGGPATIWDNDAGL